MEFWGCGGVCVGCEDGGGYEVAGFKRGCAMDNGAMWV